MKNPQIPNEIYEIRHQEDPTKNLSDAAMTTLFQTHIAIAINSANLVWQRFSIMLAANAIIFGFLANKSAPATIDVVFGSLFGLVLCVLWYVLIASEWNFFQRWMSLSRRFTFPTLLSEANPHREIFNNPIPHAGAARWAVYGVIGLFTFAYAFLLVRFCFEKGC